MLQKMPVRPSDSQEVAQELRGRLGRQLEGLARLVEEREREEEQSTTQTHRTWSDRAARVCMLARSLAGWRCFVARDRSLRSRELDQRRSLHARRRVWRAMLRWKRIWRRGVLMRRMRERQEVRRLLKGWQV